MEFPQVLLIKVDENLREREPSAISAVILDSHLDAPSVCEGGTIPPAKPMLTTSYF